MPLHVRSAFTWEPGTWVTEEDPTMEQAIISAVTHDTCEAKVTVTGVPDQPGIAARLFRALADVDVNVDMIVQNVSDHGVTDISFTVPQGRPRPAAPRSASALADEIGATGVSSDRDIARVSIVGAGMKSNPGVAATMFETLAERGHQHRDDLDLGHPHQLRGRARTRSSGRCRACTRPSASTPPA